MEGGTSEELFCVKGLIETVLSAYEFVIRSDCSTADDRVSDVSIYVYG